jgi:hypothetical protein
MTSRSGVDGERSTTDPSSSVTRSSSIDAAQAPMDTRSASIKGLDRCVWTLERAARPPSSRRCSRRVGTPPSRPAWLCDLRCAIRAGREGPTRRCAPARRRRARWGIRVSARSGASLSNEGYRRQTGPAAAPRSSVCLLEVPAAELVDIGFAFGTGVARLQLDHGSTTLDEAVAAAIGARE